ncbi:MAG TPA: polysaccharide biosynthesis protein [Bacillota bacterium]|nr:polysaccharide biosynthesis protein [Bacillota bacterium]
MSGPGFLKGAFILSVAAFVSKLLGLLYVIPLKHYAGDEGLALYQAVFPIYNTLLILSVSGIPIALSKLISEKIAYDQIGEIRPITMGALKIMITVAIGGFIVLFFGSSLIANWIGSVDTIPSIEAMAFAMVLVPFLAVLRGYFYGYQKMNLSAMSQIIEQLVRVSVMMLLVYLFVRMGKDIATVSAGAAIGSFAGISVALSLLVYQYLRFRPHSKERKAQQENYTRQILGIAIPVSLSTLMLPVLGLVDSMTIMNVLKSTGIADSTAQFGVYSRGVPIVQFAAFYATGLSVAVVPALTSARLVEEKTKQIRKTLEVSFFIGVPASVGMMLIANPLNILFYGNSQGSETLSVLAASTIFLSLAITTSGVLQGLGRSIWPALFLFLSVFLKVVGNIWLVKVYGIVGAAYSTILAYACITILSLIAIRVFHPSSDLFLKRDCIRWFFPSILMGVGIYLFKGLGIDSLQVSNLIRIQALFSMVMIIMVGVVIYVVGLLLFRVFTWHDILHLRSGILKIRKRG